MLAHRASETSGRERAVMCSTTLVSDHIELQHPSEQHDVQYSNDLIFLVGITLPCARTVMGMGKRTYLPIPSSPKIIKNFVETAHSC